MGSCNPSLFSYVKTTDSGGRRHLAAARMLTCAQATTKGASLSRQSNIQTSTALAKAKSALSHSLHHTMLYGWVLLPLRAFLGITFLYAGIQKLTDPSFFKPTAIGYIGKQIAAFAHGSPIRGLLLSVALPHAVIFGGLIAYGEIAIGIGTLLGFLLRPAAIAGALLSLMFFLSASWHVRPYFYGSDIVFIFAWIPLALAGPLSGGVPALGNGWIHKAFASAPKSARVRYAPAVSLMTGVSLAEPTHAISTAQPVAVRDVTPTRRGRQTVRATPRGRYPANSRREFIRGLVGGAVGMLAVNWIWSAIANSQTAAGSQLPASVSSAAPGAGAATTAAPSGTIATVSQLATDGSATFTIPSNGDPGIVVRLSSGSVVAFDATCTHAGCPVQYDPSTQLLICPCHGAEFDPAHAAAVVQGPAPTPLTPVTVNVNNATGDITLAQ